MASPSPSLNDNPPAMLSPNYQVVKEMQPQGKDNDRVSYLAQVIDGPTPTQPEELVVITQWRCPCGPDQAVPRQPWEVQQHQLNAIKLLQRLDHPRIPRYRDSFTDEGGFYVVQDYVALKPLGDRENLTPQELKTVASSVLEILLYLQNLNPIVIHGNLTPQNILITEDLEVYLVNFHGPHPFDQTKAPTVKLPGTAGLIPPELLFQLSLNESADLYSLGVSLISILTGYGIEDLPKLYDRYFQLKFQQKLTGLLHSDLIRWLEKWWNPIAIGVLPMPKLP
ncbi:MAG: protein kinase [Synechococcaceae cyanobacterium RL_1_2]|nr:protein kinase [Synechococcaceae cyanobacterium RL_1_2]